MHDEERRQLVVNWQAPAARPFYTATPEDPHGVTLRRRFRTDGRRVLDIADESLDGSILDGAAVGDFLLEELERNRDAHMRDIVATIQADQYRLITAEPDAAARDPGRAGHRQDRGRAAPRVVPALHASRHPARRGVLVIGPNRTFMEYVSHVLPALGENAVEQRAVASSSTASSPSCATRRAVAELKADLRMAEVVAARRRAAARLGAGGARAPARRLVHLGAACARCASCSTRRGRRTARRRAARERFRMSLLRRFYEEYGRVLGGAAIRNFEEVEQALRANGYLDRVLKAAWPLVAPDKLVRSLLTNRAALAEAADGILDADEQRLLYRRGQAGRTATCRSSTRRARCSRRRRTPTAT